MRQVYNEEIHGGVLIMNRIITEKHPFIQLSKEFAELCKPLELLNIKHITYLKHFNDGSRVALSNKPHWVDDYYNLGLYESSLFEKKPSEYKAEFGVWLGEYDLEVYLHGRQYYHTYSSITMNEPVHDGCEFFLFSVAKDQDKAILYLASNMEILYHFILFVRNRGFNLLKTCFKHRLILPSSLDKKIELPLEENSTGFNQHMLEAKKNFFKQTALHQYQFINPENKNQLLHFTQRELKCLYYLLEKKTAIETAKLMNISRRTVESYLENMKNKLGAENKTALVHKIKQFHLLASPSNLFFQ